MKIAKVVSGGQTGVDMAGLRAARDVGLPTGGWAPRGWLTEDGPQPELLRSFGLKEHQAYGYPPRTEQNVIDSDCTLLITNNRNSGGSRLTHQYCLKWKRPVLTPGHEPRQRSVA